MPSSLIQTNAIAGPFTLAYTPPGGASGSLGVIGREGFRVMRSHSAEPITCDQYGGDTVIDGVYTGGSVYLEFLLQEANRACCKALAFPFNETSTNATPIVGQYSLEHELGVPGMLLSSAAGALVATAVAGTLAAAETTPTRTFSLVTLAPGHNIDAFLKAGLKTFPMRLLCIPYIVSSKTVFYTRS